MIKHIKQQAVLLCLLVVSAWAGHTSDGRCPKVLFQTVTKIMLVTIWPRRNFPPKQSNSELQQVAPQDGECYLIKSWPIGAVSVL